jgi:uncharacterized spore protein YtfJ
VPKTVEELLREIAEHTKATREAVERGGRDRERGAARDDSRFAKLGDRVERAAASQIGQRLAQAQGLAARGFAGTAEGVYNSYAMDMLGRQFAAVMLPVMQAATYLAEQVERRMRNMSGTEQNRLLGMGLGAAAGLRFGPFAAIAGGVMGGILGSGDRPGPYDMYGGVAAGAYTGFRMGGLPGAAGGMLVGAAMAAPTDYASERPSSYYTRMRAGGMDRFSAGVAVAGRSLGHLFGAADSRPGAPPGAAAEAPRRDVTPYKFEVGDAGSSFWRIQEGVMKATGGGAGDGGPFKPIVDVLLMILDQLIRMGGGSPPPRPAGE